MAGGGAERQLVYLCGELVQRGWDVHVALLKEGRNFEGLVATGCRIHKIPALGNHDISIMWRLTRLIKQIRPTIIQTWMRQMDILGGISSRITGTPFLLSERSSSSAYPRSFKHALRILAGRHAEAIICNSGGGSDYWRSKTSNSAVTHIIPNAVPMADIEKAAVAWEFPIPLQKKVILCAGRFTPEKNIATIIRVFRKVTDGLDAILLLCGEGKFRSQIEALISREDLTDRVILPGYVKDIWGLMKRADLFISMSTHEGCPNAVLEAMACSCPLVVSDIPAHRAFLDEETALFVDPANMSGTAAAIKMCLEDQKMTERMVKKAKARVATFSIRSVTDQYEMIYDSILRKRTTERH